MRLALGLLVAALAGFISLSYEILWYRAYSVVSRCAPEAFGYLLAAYLAGIAFGALAARAWCRDREAGDTQLRALYAFVLFANAFGFLVVPLLGAVATMATWHLSLPVVTVAAALLGAVLPLVAHLAVRPDANAGAGLSYLYLSNIIGSASGSLVTGFVLMDVLSMRSIALLVAILGLCLALGLVLATRPRGLELAKGVGTVAAFAVLEAALAPALFDGLLEKLTFRHAYKQEVRFAEVIENRSGVITVTHDGLAFGTGVYDGIFSWDLIEDRNWVARPYSVAALHPNPREVLVVGLGTGSWTQALVHLPGVEHLTAIEINPGYLPLIRRHPEVSSLLDNPKVEMVIDDGRRWLARHPERKFDAIVQNTTWYWHDHATNLLSTEYLSLVRSRLKPGGLCMINTTFSPEAMRTGATVFPFAMRVYNSIVGSDSPLVFDGERFRRVLTELRIDGKPVFDLSRADHRARLETLASLGRTLEADEPVGLGLESRERLLARTEGFRIVTDDNMATEWKSH